MAFKPGMKVHLCMGYGRFDDLHLDDHSGSAEEQIQLRIISTTKQARNIKLGATVGHDKFYFGFKSSAPVVFNYGHTSVSCKTYVRSLVSQCLFSERAFGVQTNNVILLSRLRVS